MHLRIENALRHYNISYKVHLHTNYLTEINNPADFATGLGYNVERVTKSV